MIFVNSMSDLFHEQYGVAHPNGETYDVMPARPRRGDLVLAFFVVCGLLGNAARLAGPGAPLRSPTRLASSCRLTLATTA